MSYADYQIRYYSSNGVLLDVLRVSNMGLVRKENEIATLSVSLAPEFSSGYFAQDGQLEVWRSVNGGTYYLLDTTWFIERIRYATNSQGQNELEITACDANGLLGRRIIAYDKGTTYTEKNGCADDIMKDIVRENYGSLAFDTERDLSSYISVAPDSSFGAIVSAEISWRRVIDVLAELARMSEENGVRIVFSLVRTDVQKFEFRTYKNFSGTDHSASSLNPVIVSIDAGNLTDAELIADYSDEINYVYAKSANVNGNSITVQIAADSRVKKSKFNRREFLADAGNTTDTNVVSRFGQYVVNSGRPRIFFNGILRDTESLVYGLDYKFGDLVTASYMGYLIDCKLNAVSIRFSQQGEQIDLRLSGEFYA